MTRQPGSDSHDPTGIRFERASGPQRLAAAQRLVEAAAPADPHAGARFLEVARLNGLDLSAFWYSRTPASDRVREVCLCIPGAGHTGMFFTSEPASEGAVEELGRLIDHVCGRVRDILLAQTLLADHEANALRAFQLGGFQAIARLSYLRRVMPRRASDIPGDPTLPEGVTCTNWRPGDDDAVMEALSRSYEGTLDCPELCGLRPLPDVLESHRATGEFDARYWWIIRHAGRPAGAMLFNILRAQSSMELVYMGMAPEIRGRGVGSALLTLGLRALAGRGESSVTCAVDHRNTPARRLYARFGFEPGAERAACIRALGAPVRHP